MHVSLLPDEASRHADAIVVGDVEPVWNQLISDYKKGNLQKFYQGTFGLPQEGYKKNECLRTGYLLVLTFRNKKTEQNLLGCDPAGIIFSTSPDIFIFLYI